MARSKPTGKVDMTLLPAPIKPNQELTECFSEMKWFTGAMRTGESSAQMHIDRRDEIIARTSNLITAMSMPSFCAYLNGGNVFVKNIAVACNGAVGKEILSDSDVARIVAMYRQNESVKLDQIPALAALSIANYMYFVGAEGQRRGVEDYYCEFISFTGQDGSVELAA